MHVGNKERFQRTISKHSTINQNRLCRWFRRYWKGSFAKQKTKNKNTIEPIIWHFIKWIIPDPS